jgi:hypothetical protein
MKMTTKKKTRDTYVLTNDGESQNCFVFKYSEFGGRVLKLWIPRRELNYVRPPTVQLTLSVTPTPASARKGRVKKP